MTAAKKIIDKGSDYTEKETERLQRMLEKVWNKSFHPLFNWRMLLLNLESNFHISLIFSQSARPKLMNLSSRRTFCQHSLLEGDDDPRPGPPEARADSTTAACEESETRRNGMIPEKGGSASPVVAELADGFLFLTNLYPAGRDVCPFLVTGIDSVLTVYFR